MNLSIYIDLSIYMYTSSEEVLQISPLTCIYAIHKHIYLSVSIYLSIYLYLYIYTSSAEVLRPTMKTISMIDKSSMAPGWRIYQG